MTSRSWRVMKEFDFYEVIGVIAPGMVLIVGAVFLFFPDQQQNLMGIANLSLGSLGVGLILAYVAGQLLQAVGNVLDTVWWSLWGGMPTDWVRSGKHALIAESQRNLIRERICIMLNNSSFDLSATDTKHWYSITRQIYAAVSAAGRAARVDIFNGNYGLCRGIAAGFLLLLAGSIIVNWRAWQIETVLVILIAFSIYRMHRFGVRYGRELFVQFLLQLPAISKEGETK